MISKLSSVVYAFAFLLLLSGCDFPGGTKEDGPPPLQTKILEVRIEPNPVAVGDTATFTAIIRDSLDTTFKFMWFLDAPTQVTEENSIQWLADVEPGQYSFSVRADNGDPDARSASREFAIEVTQ